MWTVVRTHLEVARCLKVVLIGWLIELLGALVPAVGLWRSLVTVWAGMWFTVWRSRMGFAMGTAGRRAVGLAGMVAAVFVAWRISQRRTACNYACGRQRQTQLECGH